MAGLLTMAASPQTPARGPLHIIGGPSNGCLAGAVQLPAEGLGFQTIHLGRSSFWGTQSTISRLETLAAQVHGAGLGDLYIEDIARPRGGPLPGGHVAHQIGLEADVGLDVTPKHTLTAAEREMVELPSLVLPDQRAVDPARWSTAEITLLHLAASLPDVDRILISPAIKRQLCNEVTGDRSWLRLIRPWYDHSAHMHIHFRCPADQHDCIQGAPPPAGDGCDATLQWWFDRLDAPAPAKPAEPYHPPPLPVACKAVMAGE